MLLAIALVALFTLTAVAVAGVLSDSAVRGWKAYRRLHRAAYASHTMMPSARLIEQFEMVELPQIRTARQPRVPVSRLANRSGSGRITAAA